MCKILLNNIFVCSCPNRPGFDAIDNYDQFEQILIHIMSPKSVKNFMNHISTIRRQKMFIILVFWWILQAILHAAIIANESKFKG